MQALIADVAASLLSVLCSALVFACGAAAACVATHTAACVLHIAGVGCVKPLLRAANSPAGQIAINVLQASMPALITLGAAAGMMEKLARPAVEI